MSDLVQRLRLAASDLTATMLDLRRIVVSPVLSAQQEATIRVLTEAAVEIERLGAEADEWAMRADGVVHHPHCTDDLPCLRCRAEQAELECNEARAEIARMREVADTLSSRATAAECALSHRIALRREIEAALGITTGATDGDALARGLAAIRALHAERDTLRALLVECRDWLAILESPVEDIHVATHAEMLARLDAALDEVSR